ncbi:hypothetical protein GGS20DRAFT_45646 [Poronia punctata]|nr:hypothetical protein GGS20DRAFT_45646 [Poronia punctata]
MSSSMYTVTPASLHDFGDPYNRTNITIQNNNNNTASSSSIGANNNNINNNHNSHRNQASRCVDSQAKNSRSSPVTPESNFLSPYSSQTHGDSASPSLNSYTPLDNISNVGCYTGSDIFTGSEFADDPFAGVTDIDQFLGNADWGHFDDVPMPGNELNHHTIYPISPHQTPSVPSNHCFGAGKTATATTTTALQGPTLSEDFIAQAEPLVDSAISSSSDAQFTPETNRASWSSNESPGHGTLAMAAQSPRVTVSWWGKGDGAPVQGVERSLANDGGDSRNMQLRHSIPDEVAPARLCQSPAHVDRDLHGEWMPNTATGHRGLAPEERPSEEVPSISQQAASHARQVKNQEVNEWLIQSAGNNAGASDEDDGVMGPASRHATAERGEDDNIPDGELPLGHYTVNRHQDGQTYFQPEAIGPYNEVDFDLMRHHRAFEDAPAIHAIQSGKKHFAPETSQAAIDRFNRQCQDSASIISKAATWGTRRRSLPSVVDMDGVISGNFLKKLSISGHARRPSFLQRFPSLRKRGEDGAVRKRNRSNASDLPPDEPEDPSRPESKESLAQPPRSPSGRSRKNTPDLNSILVGMATGVASIGTPQHARSPSVCATAVASPKSSFPSLSVPQLIRRGRSHSELPKPSIAELSHPNLVGMLRRQGGPPVAQLPLQQPQAQVEVEDEEDDDDDGIDDTDFKIEPGRASIEASLNGFKAHILSMNPNLAAAEGAANTNSYLVDRIAYQMLSRYKQLLTMKVKHINHVKQGKCSSGYMCRSAGAGIRYLDSRGGERGVDPLSANPLSSDEEGVPMEGGINAESFPPGIPKPPPHSLPAEFECTICFTSKKIQKPSDWTKHVHEDVQPFTCTWDKCRDPKMFKRKADWVRHENEGHRHLEWWTCDVEECRHTCYRRDNFLQHLVREHKFLEPRFKTKASIKKSGGIDRTWQKVEQCHHETTKRPAEEPCRFCGKVFPTWKKLTVHLAKHMENICLPVLRLVFEKDLDANTIISPVQEPPPRAFPPAPSTPSIKPDPHDVSPHIPQSSAAAGLMNYHTTANSFGLSPIPQAPVGSPYYPQPPAPQYHVAGSQANTMMLQSRYPPQRQYLGLSVTTTPFTNPDNFYQEAMPVPDTEAFPAFDSLGIQDPAGALGYPSLGNPALHSVDRYGSNPGSASPYDHSPHPPQHNAFYDP